MDHEYDGGRTYEALYTRPHEWPVTVGKVDVEIDAHVEKQLLWPRASSITARAREDAEVESTSGEILSAFIRWVAAGDTGSVRSFRGYPGEDRLTKAEQLELDRQFRAGERAVDEHGSHYDPRRPRYHYDPDRQEWVYPDSVGHSCSQCRRGSSR